MTITEVRVGPGMQAQEVQEITFILKDYALFTGCLIENSSIPIGNIKNLDVGMLMYNLSEYSGNYAKITGIIYH